MGAWVLAPPTPAAQSLTSCFLLPPLDRSGFSPFSFPLSQRALPEGLQSNQEHPLTTEMKFPAPPSRMLGAPPVLSTSPASAPVGSCHPFIPSLHSAKAATRRVSCEQLRLMLQDRLGRGYWLWPGSSPTNSQTVAGSFQKPQAHRDRKCGRRCQTAGVQIPALHFTSCHSQASPCELGSLWSLPSWGVRWRRMIIMVSTAWGCCEGDMRERGSSARTWPAPGKCSTNVTTTADLANVSTPEADPCSTLVPHPLTGSGEDYPCGRPWRERGAGCCVCTQNYVTLRRASSTDLLCAHGQTTHPLCFSR